MAGERRGDIQGMRALAVVLVVVYHTRLALPGGFIGVDVFFVISGYVITRLLIGELDRTGRIDYAAFYLRRIRRILPALAVLLVPVLLAGLWLGPIGGQVVSARTAIAAALFNANSYLGGMVGDIGTGGYFDPSAELNTFLHTWSLSVEEQFYLGFPLLLGLSWRFGERLAGVGNRATVAGGLAGLGLLSFALSTVLTHTADPLNDRADLAFYLAPARAWEFAAGAGLVFLAPRARTLPAGVATSLAGLGIGLIAGGSVIFDEHTAFPGLAALIPVLGTAALIVAGEGPTRNPVRAALEWRPSQWLGDLSYSWYLWHWPLIVFAGALWPGNEPAMGLAAIVSIAPALASYRLVENPIRFRPVVARAATWRLGYACVVVPIVAGLVFESGREAVAETTAMVEFEDAFALHADLRNGCDNLTPFGQRRGDECTWSVQEPQGHAFLLGDSNAGHLTEGFVRGMNEAGFDATVVTKSNCPFGEVTLTWFSAPLTRCADFVAQTTIDVIAAAPDLVVLVSSSDQYTTEPEYGMELGGLSGAATSPSEKADFWSEALARTISTFETAGIEVVIVHPVPKHSRWDPNDCSVALWSVAPDRCAVSTRRADAEVRRAEAVAAEIEAASSATRTVDLFDEICPGERCRALDEGFWRYRDRGHISVAQSELLAPRFRALLDDD